MDNIHTKVMNFIRLFHPEEQMEVSEVHLYMYTNGQCFRFAQILHTAFFNYDPKIIGYGRVATAHKVSKMSGLIENCMYNHFVCEINHKEYDIAGEYFCDPDIPTITIPIRDKQQIDQILAPMVKSDGTFDSDYRFRYQLSDADITYVLSNNLESYRNVSMTDDLMDVLCSCT